MASGRRPEHKGPPEIVSNKIIFLYIHIVLSWSKLASYR